ncbi:MAG TPA: hypothetical protein VGM62_10995 [Chthoniobacterales bacterium]|jgi:hypothetical protein
MRHLSSIVFGVLTACGLFVAPGSEAAGSRLTGYFAYRSGSERDDISIYITIPSQSNGKLSSILWLPIPMRMAPLRTEKVKAASNLTVYFAFLSKTASQTKGATHFDVAKDGYLLSIDIEDVQDSRCLAYYGKHILQRNQRSKHPTGLTMRSSERIETLPLRLALASDSRCRSCLVDL